MRPKKIILLIDSDESQASVTRFMLETRGFRVIACGTSHDAIEHFASNQVDGVVALFELPGMNGNDLIGHLKDISAEIPMALISRQRRPGEIAHQADRFLGKGVLTPVDLFECVRVLCMRKRGPKKKPVGSVGADDSFLRGCA